MWAEESESSGKELNHYLTPKKNTVNSHRSTVGNIRPTKDQKPGWGVQTVELLKREFLELKRNPMIMRARVFQSVFAAFLAGIVFFDLGREYRTVDQMLYIYRCVIVFSYSILADCM